MKSIESYIDYHRDLERLRVELRNEIASRDDRLQSAIQRLIDQLHTYCVTQERLVLKLDTYVDTHTSKIALLEDSVLRLEQKNLEEKAKWQLISSTKSIWVWVGKVVLAAFSLSIAFQGTFEILKILKN